MPLILISCLESYRNVDQLWRNALNFVRYRHVCIAVPKVTATCKKLSSHAKMSTNMIIIRVADKVRPPLPLPPCLSPMPQKEGYSVRATQSLWWYYPGFFTLCIRRSALPRYVWIYTGTKIVPCYSCFLQSRYRTRRLPRSAGLKGPWLHVKG